MGQTIRGAMFGAAMGGLALPLHAQEPVIQGMLATGDGAPVQGYPVIIEGAGGQTVTITDESGMFEVPQLPPGSYSAIIANRSEAPIAFTVEPAARGGLFRFLGPRTGAAVDLGRITVTEDGWSR